MNALLCNLSCDIAQVHYAQIITRYFTLQRFRQSGIMILTPAGGIRPYSLLPLVGLPRERTSDALETQIDYQPYYMFTHSDLA
jgi:hypothetical protein